MICEFKFETHHETPKCRGELPFVRLRAREPKPVGLESLLLPLLRLLLLASLEVAESGRRPSSRLANRCWRSCCLRRPAGQAPSRNPCAVPSHDNNKTALRDDAAMLLCLCASTRRLHTPLRDIVLADGAVHGVGVGAPPDECCLNGRLHVCSGSQFEHVTQCPLFFFGL